MTPQQATKVKKILDNLLQQEQLSRHEYNLINNSLKYPPKNKMIPKREKKLNG